MATRIQALQDRIRELYRAGRLDDAFAACRELIDAAPDRPDVYGFAGMVALRREDHATAVDLLSEATARKPDFAEAHFNRGSALKALGRTEEAAQAFGRAVAARPDMVPAQHALGVALQMLERWDEAAAAYRKVLAAAPGAPEPLRNLGMVEQRRGDRDAAEAIYRKAIAARPEWGQVHANLVTLLLERGAHERALTACDHWLACRPGDVEAMAMRCVALNEAGASAELNALMDFDRFVLRFEAVPPEGYADLAAFNRALAEHVYAHPTLKVPPSDDPTYHHPKLMITGELLVDPKGPVAELEAIVRDNVARYLQSVPREPSHPFLEHFPERWRLTMWAVVLKGAGHLVPHIHLEGYLGGVYYPQVPAALNDETAGEAGYFELGRPPTEELPLRAEPVLRRIRAEEGVMLLFPGYFYHATVPFEADEDRISIAFDLVPED